MSIGVTRVGEFGEGFIAVETFNTVRGGALRRVRCHKSFLLLDTVITTGGHGWFC